jgi:hypothetical protein
MSNFSDLFEEVVDFDPDELRVGTNGYTAKPLEFHTNTNVDEREYFECNACGWCATPNKCVSSIECPECAAAPSELCRDTEAGNRVTSYHEERWQEVHMLYGTYYK